MNKAYYESPIGLLELIEKEQEISAVRFVNNRGGATEVSPLLERCKTQLAEYFAGRRREFSLPLVLEGTEFQRRIWRQLLTIPYGSTTSYGELARALGKKQRAAQAVGGAVGRNKITLIIPCHRVIGSDGSLTGYGGGLARKKWLLEHENASF